MGTTSGLTDRVGLARLLVDYRDRTGDSYTELARKTGITRGFFGYLINKEPPLMVAPETVRKLADGLGIPLDVVRSAALASSGLSPDTQAADLPEPVALIAEQMRGLSDHQLEIVAGVVQGLRGPH
jgi:transcriptional regulator with XRE-family HTH domain